ncbi:4152_t:CDS:1, partial [Cetraspora pellucida]
IRLENKGVGKGEGIESLLLDFDKFVVVVEINLTFDIVREGKIGVAT